MQKSIAITALAGLAASAAAQGLIVNFEAAQTQVQVGDTINWSVVVTHTGYADSSAYFGGFSGPEPGFGTFIASDNGLGTAQNLTNLMGGEGLAASANGASVEEVNIFNSALLGTNDPTNPLEIFTFDVVTSAEGELSYSADGVWSVFPDDGIFTLPDEFTGPAVNSDTVSIVPAPGAFALLGLGGLAAARRRR